MQVYNKTDQTMHLLCQLLAKAGRSFVPKQSDDSHSNLYFDAIGRRINTHFFAAPHQSLALSLNLDIATYEWLDKRQQTEVIVSYNGKTTAETEAELAAGVVAKGLSAGDYSEELHFEIPDYGLTHKPLVAPSTEAIEQWRYYRRLANQAGTALLGYLQANGQPRIWPHHFDTGTYSIIDEHVGIGYGLAMQDTIVSSPYFYIAGYAQNGEVDYEQAADLTHGHWIKEGHWKGAVLPVTALPGKGSMKMILNFVQEATTWYVRAEQK